MWWEDPAQFTVVVTVIIVVALFTYRVLKVFMRG
jgi:hypothetical protein